MDHWSVLNLEKRKTVILLIEWIFFVNDISEYKSTAGEDHISYKKQCAHGCILYQKSLISCLFHGSSLAAAYSLSRGFPADKIQPTFTKTQKSSLDMPRLITICHIASKLIFIAVILLSICFHLRSYTCFLNQSCCSVVFMEDHYSQL